MTSGRTATRQGDRAPPDAGHGSSSTPADHGPTSTLPACEPSAPAIEPDGASLQCTVSIQVVKRFVDAVHKIAGVPQAALLRAAKLEPEQLEQLDARVTRSVVYQLAELALDLTGDPALGLHWAERIREGSFVPVSSLIAHAATLRQAFAALCQFQRLLTDSPGYRLLEQDQTVALQRLDAGGSPRVERFSAEMMVAGLFRVVRDFNVNALPIRVSFRYSAPSYVDEYERMFDGAPLFDQAFTGLTFDRSLLDLPAPHEDKEVHEALQALAARRLSRITQQTPYSRRVRELLVQHGQPPRTHDMKEIARSLGLSERSLRRRLAAEGTTYNAVLHDALATMAKHLLLDKRRTIQETAYEMGFSDASTFHRAFKSWTGMTPTAHREQR